MVRVVTRCGLSEPRSGGQRETGRADSGHPLEPLLSKVGVEGKGFIQPESTHHFEAHAIHQAQVPAPCREQGGYGEPMDRFVDPKHPKKRHEPTLEVPHGW